MSGVLAISDQERRLVDALEHLREKGFAQFEAFSPLPSGELLEACGMGTTPIRYYTFAGGILGLLGGMALTYGTALSWPLITGGKPIVAFTGFSVVIFELTILFAGLSTVAGFVLHGGLFRSAVPGVISKARYSERFLVDTFGLFVACGPEQVEEVSRVLRACGLEEISIETA